MTILLFCNKVRICADLLAEEILGNEEFINRLARSNKGLFNKIRNFISDKVNSKNQSEQYKTAQYLFDKALKEIKDSIDNGGEIKYARKGYVYRSINEITAKEYRHHAWIFVNNVISKSEWGVVNSALADIKIGKKYPFNAGIYMIPTGEYAGENTVYNKIVFTDANFEEPSIIKVIEIDKNFEKENKFIEWLFEEFKNGLSKSGEVFRAVEMYSKQQGEMFSREISVEDFGTLSEIRQQRSIVGKDNSDNKRKQDGRRNNEKTRISLKDSEGNTLTENQQEFFKNSKIRDKDGNLLVVYHGSPTAGFGVFKTEPFGAWFTEDKNYAIEHTKGLPYNVYKAYLNIKKPFTADNPKMTELHYEQFFNGEEFNEKLLYTKEFRDYLVKQGFDGMMWEHNGYKTVVAFYPNQIKLTTNKKPTRANDIRFSLKDKADINQYTERQYNDFGWARVNGVLSANENYNFKEKYRAIKDKTLKNLVKSASNEIIVEANNMKGADFAVNNTLVYAKGPYEDYKITKVIKINLNTETDIEFIRRSIYEWEQRGWSRTDSIIERVFGKELVRIYRLGDCSSYRELKQQRQNSVTNKTDNSFLQNGRRNFDEDSGIIKFSRKVSEGQITKKLADYTRKKVYSKVEAERTINTILESNFGLEDYNVEISGKFISSIKNLIFYINNGQIKSVRCFSWVFYSFVIDKRQ